MHHSLYRTSSGGYTLVEALVAGIVLMIAIGAAAKLSLALTTQDEMNQRSTVALNYHETVIRLYQMGLDETAIRQIIPNESAVTSLTITPGAPTIAGLESATIAISFLPSPATQTWTGFSWTAGKTGAARSASVVAYRSAHSSTVD